MGLSLEMYQKILRKLLPPGKMWRFREDSNFYKLLYAFAAELKRVDDSIEDVAFQIIPLNTIDFLTDWERILKLTDTEDKTDQQRRNDIIFKLNVNGSGKQFFIDLAARIGFVINIEEYRPFVAGSYAGEYLTSGDWPFTFKINFESEPSLEAERFYLSLKPIKPANVIMLKDYDDDLIFDDNSYAIFNDGAKVEIF